MKKINLLNSLINNILNKLSYGFLWLYTTKKNYELYTERIDILEFLERLHFPY